MRDVLDVTLVLDTLIYADGDVLAVPQEITGFLQGSNKAELESVELLDEDDQGIALDLLFLNGSATLGTINEAPSISDADARKIVGRVRIATTDYIDLGGSRLATVNNINMPIEASDTINGLWIAAITRGGTPTHTAAGIKLKLAFNYGD